MHLFQCVTNVRLILMGYLSLPLSLFLSLSLSLSPLFFPPFCSVCLHVAGKTQDSANIGAFAYYIIPSVRINPAMAMRPEIRLCALGKSLCHSFFNLLNWIPRSDNESLLDSRERACIKRTSTRRIYECSLSGGDTLAEWKSLMY